MKNIPSKLYIALFLTLCLVFSLGLLLPGARVDDGVPMPAFITDGKINSRFGGEFEEWFSKHFAFHHSVTDCYADLKLSLFGEGNDQVIVGKEGFLFFDDTTADYLGSDPMTDGQIASVADGLAHLHTQVTEAGGKFLFLCAPNKNTVYGEYMPERYLKSTVPSDLDRLYLALDERRVPYADLRPVLLSAKDDALVYHKRDTHWNGTGAKLAFEEAAQILDISSVDLSSCKPIYTKDFPGDLDGLLYPGETRYDDNITYDFSGLYVYTSAFSTPMDMVITTRGGGEGKLLLFRDSFTNALIPYAASSFAETRMERGTPYQLTGIEAYQPDVVIVEIAERNIRQLLGHLGLE